MNADENLIVERFDELVSEHVASLISDDVVEEHRANVYGPHSQTLQYVTTYFRCSSIVDKLAILAVVQFDQYRIIKLSGVRGVPPVTASETIYRTEKEAEHAIFVMRVATLKAGISARKGRPPSEKASCACLSGPAERTRR